MQPQKPKSYMELQPQNVRAGINICLFVQCSHDSYSSKLESLHLLLAPFNTPPSTASPPRCFLYQCKRFITATRQRCSLLLFSYSVTLLPRNPSADFCYHESSQYEPIPSQLNPLHTTYRLSKINCNVILPFEPKNSLEYRSPIFLFHSHL
jgi:hypothetical protein